MNIKTILGILVMMSGALAVEAQTGWQEKVNEALPLLGHRNWIVVVDSAYPLQSSPGIETVETSADQLVVLDYVLDAIKSSKHVRPLVHTDSELRYVPESKASGVDQYRNDLQARLAGLHADSILHQKLIDQLNALGRDFHVLILKTTMTIPYTSVFLQLDCKYWSAEDEAGLRAKMNGASHEPGPHSK
jgi:hypothetical protein